MQIPQILLESRILPSSESSLKASVDLRAYAKWTI